MRRAGWTLLLSLLVLSAHAEPPTALRVCADPNNLPFSNKQKHGLENKLAALLAADLGRPLEYHWWAQRRGYIRNTLKAGACDVLMGVPSELDMVLTSAPYYRSSYVFVTRSDGPEALHSLDDPRLRTLRIGVPVVGDDYANPPPVHALANRGITDNVVGFSVFGDYGTDSPPLELLRALEAGKLDVAIVWGPLAGFEAKRHPGTLVVSRGLPAREGPYPFEFSISLGVRKDDQALLTALEGSLARQHRRVQELLDEYGVPRL